VRAHAHDRLPEFACGPSRAFHGSAGIATVIGNAGRDDEPHDDDRTTRRDVAAKPRSRAGAMGRKSTKPSVVAADRIGCASSPFTYGDTSVISWWYSPESTAVVVEDRAALVIGVTSRRACGVGLPRAGVEQPRRAPGCEFRPSRCSSSSSRYPE